MWPMRKDWVLFWISGMRDEFTSVHQSLSWHTFRDVKYPSPLPVPLINGIFCMLKRCDETESFFLLHINSNLNSPLVQRLTEDGLWTEFASGTFEHLFVRQPTTSFRLYFMTDCIMALGQHPASQPTIHPFFIHWRKGPKIRPNVQFIISTLIMLIVLLILILISIHILWNTFYEFQWVGWVFGLGFLLVTLKNSQSTSLR